jgi:hypothetical protein
VPLVNSASKEAFQQNVAQLIKDGKPRDQAVAIAYDIQRKAKKKNK